MKKKIVLCGSMKNLELFRKTKKKYPEYEFFPTEEHLSKINDTVRNIDAPIPNEKRLRLILEHLSYIREADEVWILNEKWREARYLVEYVGVGTALDIGYALALDKQIKWLHRPSDPNLIAIFEGCPSKEVRKERMTIKEN